MKSQKKELSEDDLFKRIEAISNMFWSKEAEGFKDHLIELLKAHRPSEWEIENRMKWFTYVLRLILICPPLLEQPPGFEWVMEDFQQMLVLRKVSPDFDRNFWDAIAHVRGILRPASRPARKDKDYFRYMRIYHMIQHDKLNKTKAIEKLAEEEVLYIKKRSNADPVDQAENKQKEIRDSLKKVEQDEQEFKDLLSEWDIGPDRRTRKKKVKT